MDITLEDLQALTLLAQDPQAKDLEKFKVQLSNETARRVAEVIVKQRVERTGNYSDSIEKTAQAIIDWVLRNRAVARPQARSVLQEREKTQKWMSQHAAAWQE